MRFIHEEIQAQGERGNKEKCRHGTNRNGVSWSRCYGRNSKCQPITPDRDDRTGGTSSSDAIAAITGGILEQLILESKEELTNSEARVNQLHSRITLLESLKASLDI